MTGQDLLIGAAGVCVHVHIPVPATDLHASAAGTVATAMNSSLACGFCRQEQEVLEAAAQQEHKAAVAAVAAATKSAKQDLQQMQDAAQRMAWRTQRWRVAQLRRAALEVSCDSLASEHLTCCQAEYNLTMFDHVGCAALFGRHISGFTADSLTLEIDKVTLIVVAFAVQLLMI